jgi:hypothetical protein
MQSRSTAPRTAAQAWAQARACAELADHAVSEERREMFLRLRDSWILIANELQLAQSEKEATRIRMDRLRTVLVENAH